MVENRKQFWLIIALLAIIALIVIFLNCKQSTPSEIVQVSTEIKTENKSDTLVYADRENRFTLSYPSIFSKISDGDYEGAPEFGVSTVCADNIYNNGLTVETYEIPLDGFIFDKNFDVGAPFYMMYSAKDAKWLPKQNYSNDTLMIPREDSYIYYLPATGVTKQGYTYHIYGTGQENTYIQTALVESPDKQYFVKIILSSGTYSCGGLIGTSDFLEILDSVKFN